MRREEIDRKAHRPEVSGEGEKKEKNYKSQTLIYAQQQQIWSYEFYMPPQQCWRAENQKPCKRSQAVDQRNAYIYLVQAQQVFKHAQTQTNIYIYANICTRCKWI